VYISAGNGVGERDGKAAGRIEALASEDGRATSKQQRDQPTGNRNR